MRKRWMLPLLVLVLLCLAGTVNAAQNLYKNGGFEELGEDGLPVDTKCQVYENDAQFLADPNNPHRGKYSIKVVASTASIDRGSVGQPVLVEAGKTYKVSVWYRTEPTLSKSDGVRLRIILRGWENEEASFKVPFNEDAIIVPPAGRARYGENFYAYADVLPSTEWRQIALTFKVPADAKMANVELFNYKGNGSVWFDDMEFIQVD
jgi:hypothetical protein